MRILNIAYTCPWPPNGGSDQRVWHLCRLLGRMNHQELLCRVTNPAEAGNFPQFHGEPVEVHNLFLPRPGPLARLLKGLRYLAGPMPVLSAGFEFKAFTLKLNELIRDGRFDIIVMDGIWLGFYWPLIQKSGALRVLNHFDQESVSLRRHARMFPPGFLRLLFTLDAKRMARMERRVMSSADLIWVTSEVDRDGILTGNPYLPVQVAPNGVDTDQIRPFDRVSSREVLFVGSFDRYCNVDAVTYYAREVHPLLRASLPDAVFRVVGRHPGREVHELGRLPGVVITGRVDDLGPWYQRCGAVVVPLRAGGGTRLKILEAMAYGRPVISTVMGCEGIQAEPNRHVLLADRPSDMAEAIRKVLTRPDFADSVRGEARARVVERYSWARIASSMHARYEQALNAKADAMKQIPVVAVGSDSTMVAG